jgi:hypothetical protein
MSGAKRKTGSAGLKIIRIFFLLRVPPIFTACLCFTVLTTTLSLPLSSSCSLQRMMIERHHRRAVLAALCWFGRTAAQLIEEGVCVWHRVTPPRLRPQARRLPATYPGRARRSEVPRPCLPSAGAACAAGAPWRPPGAPWEGFH